MTTTSSSRFDWKKLTQRDENDKLVSVDGDALQEGIFDENIELLSVLDRYMFSIYIRAIHESKKYFAAYDRYISTEYSTTLQPRIRWRPGRAVEMEWIRRIATEKPATEREIRMYKHPTRKNGVTAMIVNRQGLRYCHRYLFKSIQRNGKRDYSKLIFSKESAWVQVEGFRLEQCFSLLRAEAETIIEIKKKVGSLHTTDKKYFDLSILSTLDFSSLGRPANCITSAATLLNEKDDDNEENSNEE